MTAHNCRTFRPILNRLDDRCLLSGLTMRTGKTLRSVSPVLQPFAIPKDGALPFGGKPLLRTTPGSGSCRRRQGPWICIHGTSYGGRP